MYISISNSICYHSLLHINILFDIGTDFYFQSVGDCVFTIPPKEVVALSEINIEVEFKGRDAVPPIFSSLKTVVCKVFFQTSCASLSLEIHVSYRKNGQIRI